MTDNDRLPKHPSQAEGDRDQVQDIPGADTAEQPEEGKDVSRHRPSQAEGSEKIVEESLND